MFVLLFSSIHDNTPLNLPSVPVKECFIYCLEGKCLERPLNKQRAVGGHATFPRCMIQKEVSICDAKATHWYQKEAIPISVSVLQERSLGNLFRSPSNRCCSGLSFFLKNNFPPANSLKNRAQWHIGQAARFSFLVIFWQLFIYLAQHQSDCRTQ